MSNAHQLYLATVLASMAAVCSAACAGSGADDDAMDPAESRESRGELGKADATGSCRALQYTHCGGKSAGACWCDDQCSDFGDCCSDFASVCTDGHDGTGGTDDWKKLVGAYSAYSSKDRYYGIVFETVEAQSGHRYFAWLLEHCGFNFCPGEREEGHYTADGSKLVLWPKGGDAVAYGPYQFKAGGLYAKAAGGHTEVYFAMANGLCQKSEDCGREASSGIIGACSGGFACANLRCACE